MLSCSMARRTASTETPWAARREGSAPTSGPSPGQASFDGSSNARVVKAWESGRHQAAMAIQLKGEKIVLIRFGNPAYAKPEVTVATI